MSPVFLTLHVLMDVSEGHKSIKFVSVKHGHPKVSTKDSKQMIFFYFFFSFCSVSYSRLKDGLVVKVYDHIYFTFFRHQMFRLYLHSANSTKTPDKAL